MVETVDNGSVILLFQFTCEPWKSLMKRIIGFIADALGARLCGAPCIRLHSSSTESTRPQRHWPIGDLEDTSKLWSLIYGGSALSGIQKSPHRLLRSWYGSEYFGRMLLYTHPIRDPTLKRIRRKDRLERFELEILMYSSIIAWGILNGETSPIC